MLLERLRRTLSDWKQSLECWWIPRVLPLGAESDRLAAEIAEEEAELAQESVVLEEFRTRVATGERQAARLTAQAAECVKAGYENQAWPFVLELEEVRKALEMDRPELARIEQLCWSREFRLRQLRRKLLEAAEQKPGKPRTVGR
jgi:predicted Zn-ribbon and HTH transcriptional regulator